MEKDWNNREFGMRGAAHSDKTVERHEGLRRYMQTVYNYMSAGLAVTGLAAYLFFRYLAGSPEAQQAVFGSSLVYVIAFTPFIFVIALSMGLSKFRLGTIHALFWLFATTMGLSLAPIFFAYTGASIAKVFFITAGTFAGMSLYGYTTQRDLTAIGSFLIMGLWGIILASIVNWFLGSSALQFVISIIGVVIFIGLTAYDTQRIKMGYYEGQGHEMYHRRAISGALHLYLDFINLFIMLLRLFGDRR